MQIQLYSNWQEVHIHSLEKVHACVLHVNLFISNLIIFFFTSYILAYCSSHIFFMCLRNKTNIQINGKCLLQLRDFIHIWHDTHTHIYIYRWKETMRRLEWQLYFVLIQFILHLVLSIHAVLLIFFV